MQTTTSTLRRILFPILAMLLSLLLCGLFFEIVLYFFPVNEGLHSMPVNADAPIFHFKPHRTSTWSRNWNFAVRNEISTNNYGFVSQIDYVPQAATPLVAVIGDSYIEAARLPWEDTGPARLQAYFGDQARCYAFGASGAALSQYLAYAVFAAREFRPCRLAILVVGNDFDESLLKYKHSPGFHYFVEGSDGGLELIRVDYEVSCWRTLIRHSRLGMYLLTNLNVLQAFRNVRAWFHPEAYVGNTASQANQERVKDSMRAIDSFLTCLPDSTHLPPEHIALVLDGIRPQLYDEFDLQATEGSYYALMRRYFIKQAHRAGFIVIDMQPIFLKHYAQHGKHFEFPNDAHWNALGHQLFSKALINSGLFNNFFHNSGQ